MTVRDVNFAATLVGRLYSNRGRRTRDAREHRYVDKIEVVQTTARRFSAPRCPGTEQCLDARAEFGKLDGFSRYWIAPDSPRVAAMSREVPAAITSMRASGCAVFILLRNATLPDWGGSKSTMKSSGGAFFATASASANEGTTCASCAGANFFKAEPMATASAS